LNSAQRAIAAAAVNIGLTPVSLTVIAPLSEPVLIEAEQKVTATAQDDSRCSDDG